MMIKNEHVQFFYWHFHLSLKFCGRSGNHLSCTFLQEGHDERRRNKYLFKVVETIPKKSQKTFLKTFKAIPHTYNYKNSLNNNLLIIARTYCKPAPFGFQNCAKGSLQINQSGEKVDFMRDKGLDEASFGLNDASK